MTFYIFTCDNLIVCPNKKVANQEDIDQISQVKLTCEHHVYSNPSVDLTIIIDTPNYIEVL